MLHDLFSALSREQSRPRKLFPSLAVIATIFCLSALACTPVHKGNVRQGISGINREHTAIVRDSFSSADIDGSGFLEHREFSAFRQGPEISRLLKQISEYNKAGVLLFDEVDENADDRISIDEMLTTINALVP